MSTNGSGLNDRMYEICEGDISHQHQHHVHYTIAVLAARIDISIHLRLTPQICLCTRKTLPIVCPALVLGFGRCQLSVMSEFGSLTVAVDGSRWLARLTHTLSEER